MTNNNTPPERIWVMPPYYTVHGTVPDISFKPVWDKGEPQAFDKPRLNAAEYLRADGETVGKLMEALRMIAGIDPWDDNDQGYVDKARAALAAQNARQVWVHRPPEPVGLSDAFRAGGSPSNCR